MTIDSETQEWRDTMADWAEATHGEVRSIRRIVQFLFLLWVVAVAGGVAAIIAFAVRD